MSSGDGTKKLTGKQALFIREYLVDLNATQAAIRAGYKPKTAQQVGCENLTKPVIAEAIQKLNAKRCKKVEIDAQYVLEQLGGMQKALVSEIFTDDHELKPISKWPDIWQRMISGIEVVELFEGHGTDRKHIGQLKKVKLVDRTKIIEMLGRHVQVKAFQENVVVKVEGIADRLQRAKERKNNG